MKNKIEDLRDHLFETIEALKDPEKPMALDRAKRISEVAQTIINSAKVENEFMELTGVAGTGFIPNGTRKALPAPGEFEKRRIEKAKTVTQTPLSKKNG